MKTVYESFKIKTRSKKIYKVANKYYFVCPTDLITWEELLPYQGLIYYNEKENSFKIIKEANFLHKNKIDEKTKFRLLKTLSERDVFGGKSKITYEIQKDN